MKTIIALTVLAISTTAALADLSGSQVTGDLQFVDIASPNYYDPGNGFVPGGYANSGGPTITLGPGDNTFGFEDGANIDTADFNGNTLTVDDNVYGGAGAANWIQTFTDTAFTGISKVSDNFDDGGVNYSIAGDVLTLTWAGTSTGGNYTAVFDVNSTAPDGASTAALLGLGLAGLGSLKRFKILGR